MYEKTEQVAVEMAAQIIRDAGGLGLLNCNLKGLEFEGEWMCEKIRDRVLQLLRDAYSEHKRRK